MRFILYFVSSVMFALLVLTILAIILFNVSGFDPA